jgi:hypothetical protein
MLTSWYRRQSHLAAASAARQGHSSAHGRHLYCRPYLEPLEDRYLLSADLSPLSQNLLVDLSAANPAPAGIFVQTQLTTVTWDGVQTVVAANHLLVSVGQPFTAAIAAVSPLDLTSTSQAAIDWGDGTQSAGTLVRYADGVELIVASKTYTNAGSFAITVAVADSAGTVLAISAAADVSTSNAASKIALFDFTVALDNPGAATGSAQQPPSNDGRGVTQVILTNSSAADITTIVVQQFGRQLPAGKVDAGDGRAVHIVVLTQGDSTPITRLIYIELNRSPFEASTQTVYQGNIDRLGFPATPVASINGRPSGPIQTNAIARGVQPSTAPLQLGGQHEFGLSAAWSDQDKSGLATLTPELVATVLCSTWGMADGPCLLAENISQSSDPADERQEEDYFAPLTLLQPAPGSAAIPNAVAESTAPSREPEPEHLSSHWYWPLLHIAAVCAAFQTMARFATTASKQPCLRDELWPDR